MTTTTKSSTPKANKGRFFTAATVTPPTDADHLRHWSRKITVWIEHSNERLNKLGHLPQRDQDKERDNVLCNRYVRVMFRPNKDEKAALIHLGSKHPGTVQTVLGALQYADHWFDRLAEGPTAGEGLNDALWELRDAIDAVVKGIAEGTETDRATADDSEGPPPMSGEARAIAILIEHPDWTDARIAGEAKLHPKTLNRYSTYKTARAMVKESGKAALTAKLKNAR